MYAVRTMISAIAISIHQPGASGHHDTGSGRWISLKFNGSPIINWFYSYGKPVGPIDGTRYKSFSENDWSKSLGYEFNYRVVGLTVK